MSLRLSLSRFDDDAGYPVVAFPCLDGGLHCEGGAIVAPANFCSDGQVPGFVGLRRLVRHTCLEQQVRALAAPATHLGLCVLPWSLSIAQKQHLFALRSLSSNNQSVRAVRHAPTLLGKV